MALIEVTSPAAERIRDLLDKEGKLETHGLRPRVVAEFEDSALLGVFGQKGQGVFPAPALVASEVERQYGVRRLGAIRDVRGSFYAISVERRIKHPAVAVLSQAAQAWS